MKQGVEDGKILRSEIYEWQVGQEEIATKKTGTTSHDESVEAHRQRMQKIWAQRKVNKQL